MTCVIGCICVIKIPPEFCSSVSDLLNNILIEPLIDCVFREIKNELVSLQRQFIKLIHFEEKNSLRTYEDAAAKKNHIGMRNIIFGVYVKQQVS